ncbi:hypothetical protein AYO22_02984 [Fonsecaea multimorphosa]|nr:hypothetical protein AYO22_02984 [Fonsecaea multimorphosa]
MSQERWEQIHRFLTFNINTTQLPQNEDITLRSQGFLRSRLEPVYSIIRANCQAAIVPSSWVSVDEAMAAFSGRSKHTLKQKGKPIKQGYKLWCLGCVGGYYLDWLLHSPIEGAEGCNRRRPISFARDANGAPIMLSETFQVPIVLLKRLKDHWPHRNCLAFLDNLFLNLNVAQTLLALGIGVMGTTRKNSKGLPEKLIALKDINQALIYGGYRAIVKDNVLCFAWQDNNIVLGITTSFSLDKVGDFVIRDRRRPGDASTNARIALPVFGDSWIKALPIPLAIDAYNHGMNAVDNANQIRSNFTSHLPFERRNWRPLAWWLFDQRGVLGGGDVPGAVATQRTANRAPARLAQIANNVAVAARTLLGQPWLR